MGDCRNGGDVEEEEKAVAWAAEGEEVVGAESMAAGSFCFRLFDENICGERAGVWRKREGRLRRSYFNEFVEPNEAGTRRAEARQAWSRLACGPFDVMRPKEQERSTASYPVGK